MGGNIRASAPLIKQTAKMFAMTVCTARPPLNLLIRSGVATVPYFRTAQDTRETGVHRNSTLVAFHLVAAHCTTSRRRTKLGHKIVSFPILMRTEFWGKV